MKLNNGFVILSSYYEAIKDLDDKTRLELWDTLIGYGMTGEMKETDNVLVKSLMIAFKPNIDSSIRRYNASVENGKKGGRPKKTQEKPNNNLNKTQEEPNQNLNKEKDKDKEKNKNNKKDIDAYNSTSTGIKRVKEILNDTETKNYLETLIKK